MQLDVLNDLTKAKKHWTEENKIVHIDDHQTHLTWVALLLLERHHLYTGFCTNFPPVFVLTCDTSAPPRGLHLPAMNRLAEGLTPCSTGRGASRKAVLMSVVAQKNLHPP